MVYAKAHLFYEQLRYVVGDETMRRVLRAYFSRWKLRHVDEDAFRRVAEDVSNKISSGCSASAARDRRSSTTGSGASSGSGSPPQIGRWRTVVTIERKGDGRMHVEKSGATRGEHLLAGLRRAP